MKYAQLWILACLAGCASVQTTSPQDRRLAFDSYTLLAQVALEEERLQDAAEYYLQAARVSDDPAVAERATRMAHRLALNDIGIEAVDRWRELAPEHEGIDYFGGIFAMRAGQLDEATADFGNLIGGLGEADIGAGLALVVEAIGDEPDTATGTAIMQALTARFPGTPEGHYGLARLAIRSGDFDIALDNARAATELEPDWLEAQLLYARTLLVSGRSDESLALAKRLAEQNDNLEARLQYAELMLSAGESETAEALLRELLDDNPGLPAAVRALAFLYMTNDRLDDAERRFNELRGDERFRDEAFYYLGRIAETREEYLQATRSYSRVTGGTHAVESQIRTAFILLDQMQDADAALRHLREFGNANPRFRSEMLLARGQLLLQMDQPEQAMQLLSDAVGEDTADQSLRGAHAQMYVILSEDAAAGGDFDAAEGWLDEGLETYPENNSLRYALALLYEDLGRRQKAVRVLEKLVEDNPDNPAFLNAFGYLLTDQFDRHDEARGYIQRALAMNPDSAAIIDSMGWVLFHLGEYESAHDYLERAWRLEKDPEIAAHLVDVLWALGRRDEAMELLDSTLEQHPDDRRLREVSRRLEP